MELRGQVRSQMEFGNEEGDEEGEFGNEEGDRNRTYGSYGTYGGGGVLRILHDEPTASH